MSFVRTASGFVRDVSAPSAAMWNILFLNFATSAFTVWEWALFVAPSANIYVAALIAMIGGLAVSSVYGLFSAAIPRSGGDYVFVSRNLNAVLGFMVGWAGCVWFLFTAAATTYWTTVSYAPFMLHIMGFTAIAGTMLTPTWIFIGGICWLLVSWILLSFGMRFYMKAMLVVVFFNIVMAATVIGLFAFAGRETFIANFNAIAGSPTAFQDVPINAANEGFTMGDWTTATFLGMLPVLYWTIGWGGTGPSYFAGEIKNVNKVRTSLFVMCATVIFVTGFVLIMTYLLDSTLGRDWLSSLVYLYMTGSSNYTAGFEPHYGYLASILTQNSFLLFIIGTAWALLGFAATSINLIIPIRYMFAWSFDRLVPSRVAYVHPRLHSPIAANTIALVASVFFYWLIYFSNLPWAQTLSLIVANSTTGMIIVFVVCLLTGTLLPYIRRDFFERSNINMRIGPIPVITLVGIVGLVYLAWNEFSFFTYSPLGANSPLPLTFSILMTFSGIPVYIIIRYLNKRRGIDLGLLFKEIPPA